MPSSKAWEANSGKIKKSRSKPTIKPLPIHVVLRLSSKIESGYIIDEELSYKGEPCWTWQDTINNRGYGVVSGYLVHRISLVNHLGRDLKPKRVVDHRCLNKKCINPLHLQEVTNRTNLKRAWRIRNAVQ